MSRRTQLSLFVPPPFSAKLEALRGLLDPVQRGLIPAHVTLCREDELAELNLAELRGRLGTTEAKPLTLRFGPAEVFQDHGILLPCRSGEDDFRALRQHVLGSRHVRRQTPHITLAHPRNLKSLSVHFKAEMLAAADLEITFTSVCRIEQEGASPWNVLETFLLTEGRA